MLPILRYVRRFDLTRIDLFDTAGEVLYRIDGVTYPESTIVDAFRDVVQRMKEDMRSVTSGISARNFDSAPDSADRRLDNTNLQEYLEQIGAADVFIKAIQSVFGGEYGQEIHLQSCLNFILFAKLTRSKSRIVYFGANNAERYAIAEGIRGARAETARRSRRRWRRRPGRHEPYGSEEGSRWTIRAHVRRGDDVNA